MADNSVALGRNSGPDVFADDDPLAELARIAGYDDKSARKPEAPRRREPAFNLEDELLREFEQYDSPRSGSDSGESLAAEPLTPATPAQPAPLAIQQVRNAPSADPFADMNLPVELPPTRSMAPQSGGPDFFSWLGASGAQQVPLPVSSKAEASFDEPAAFREVPQRPVAHEATFEPAVDLEAELESSLAVAPPVAATSRPVPKAYTPGFQMPLANFNRAANPPRPASEPLQEHELLSDFDLADELSVPSAERSEPVVPTAAVVPVEAVRHEPRLESAPAVSQRFSPLEEQIYDLERSPRAATIPDLAPTFEAKRDDILKREPEFDTRSTSSRQQVPDDVNAFSDDEFDLALDDLELDLSDIVSNQMATEAQSEPRHQNPSAAEPAPPGYQTYAQVAAVSIAAPAAVAVAAAEPVAVPEEEFDFGSGDEAFDPAQLAESEEMPEAVPELDVPELPVEEPEQVPVHHHSDYDLDLDSELASLLEASAPSMAPAAVATAGIATAAAATAAIAVSRRRHESKSSLHPQPAHQQAAAGVNTTARDKAVQDFDEFERALEEDFRRSLANPLPQRTGDTAREEEILPYAEQARRSPGRWMMPLSVAGFVLIVGASGYAWWASDKGRISTSGAPVVIAADTTPVKIAPENPGGKTVPNQDKAVYDRVAGGAPKDPKQATLISTDEQPMDVVQKTLVPENLPLEGVSEEANAPATPVNDTKDPRLLPQQAQANGAAEDPLSVMPRKVKTMVVRPDGSLVEQQVTKPAAVASVQVPATAVKSEKIPSQPALAEPNAKGVLPGNAADQKPTDIASVNVAKVSTMTGTSQAPAAASAAPVGTPAKPGTPIPTARPAEQPVKVVASVSEQGTVKPAPQPAAAPTVTASVSPAASASGNGGYYIQVASLPSEAEAQKSYKSITAKFGNVIAGRGVDIAKAEIAGKGTFYRVRIPAGSKDDAVALCEKYRAAGGTCLVAR